MKKLFTVSLLAGLLSMPSIVFAEASWYGSIRGGVEFGGGADAKFQDGGSRWGIKGSSEVSEGLTAKYQFEHKLSTVNASQSGGRLAYVGLSGGFGTVSLGQVWSASFNSVGAITDNSSFYGNSETSYRVPSAVSYALSAGNVSFQVDAIMNPDVDTGSAIDQMEFGMSLNVDAAKIAVAYVDVKDSMKTITESVFDPGKPTIINVKTGKVNTPTVVTTTTQGVGGTATTVTLKKVPVKSLTYGLSANTAKTAADVVSTAMWSVNAVTSMNGAVQYEMSEVMDMESSVMLGADGTIPDDPNDDNSTKKMVKPVLVVTPGDGLGADIAPAAGGAGVAAGDFTVSGNVYTHSRCGPGSTVVCKTTAVLLAEYTTTANNINTNNYSLISHDSKSVSHTGNVYVVTDRTAGTNGTATVVTTSTAGAANEPTEVTVTQAGVAPSFSDVEKTNVTKGSRSSHVAVEYTIGGLTAYLGHSQSKTNGGSGKSKTTHFGIRGGLGDTGLSFVAMGRNKKAVDGTSTSPWLVGVTRSLGGGASAHFEHGNSDDGTSGKTRVGLHVGF